MTSTYSDRFESGLALRPQALLILLFAVGCAAESFGPAGKQKNNAQPAGAKAIGKARPEALNSGPV